MEVLLLLLYLQSKQYRKYNITMKKNKKNEDGFSSKIDTVSADMADVKELDFFLSIKEKCLTYMIQCTYPMKPVLQLYMVHYHCLFTYVLTSFNKYLHDDMAYTPSFWRALILSQKVDELRKSFGLTIRNIFTLQYLNYSFKIRTLWKLL